MLSIKDSGIVNERVLGGCFPWVVVGEKEEIR